MTTRKGIIPDDPKGLGVEVIESNVTVVGATITRNIFAGEAVMRAELPRDVPSRCRVSMCLR